MTVAPADSASGSASRRPRRLPRTARKVTLIVHLITSIGWLTLTACVLVLDLTALATSDADTLRSAYRAMPLLGDALIPPLSLLSLVSGLILALGIPGGCSGTAGSP